MAARLGVPTPVVVAQVCADSLHPFAFVGGSRVAVGPSGDIYVAWELFGKHQRPRRARDRKKTTIKILFPLVLMILPAMLLIIIGPAIVQTVRTLSF
jgi:hypothetical protein